MVANRYHLLEPIGRGGMGVVWSAHDKVLDRKVAVKEVRYASVLGDEVQQLNRRTMREARAAARLDHPNVVVVHDVIEEDGRPWIVMQLVPSRSLGQVIKQEGRLLSQRVAKIGLEVVSALRSAHKAGVLHRDVKPENVLLADDGRVVLTDFGIATLEAETALTMTGLAGTPAFIAPERLRGRPARRESDLWSLGATLYAAVEGRSPHDRGTAMATMHSVLMDPPDPAPHAGALLPVIEGLLVKEPVQRLDHDEATRMLRQVLDGRSPTRIMPAIRPVRRDPQGPVQGGPPAGPGVAQGPGHQNPQRPAPRQQQPPPPAARPQAVPGPVSREAPRPPAPGQSPPYGGAPRPPAAQNPARNPAQNPGQNPGQAGPRPPVPPVQGPPRPQAASRQRPPTAQSPAVQGPPRQPTAQTPAAQPPAPQRSPQQPPPAQGTPGQPMAQTPAAQGSPQPSTGQSPAAQAPAGQGADVGKAASPPPRRMNAFQEGARLPGAPADLPPLPASGPEAGRPIVPTASKQPPPPSPEPKSEPPQPRVPQAGTPSGAPADAALAPPSAPPTPKIAPRPSSAAKDEAPPPPSPDATALHPARATSPLPQAGDAPPSPRRRPPYARTATPKPAVSPETAEKPAEPQPEADRPDPTATTKVATPAQKGKKPAAPAKAKKAPAKPKKGAAAKAADADPETPAQPAEKSGKEAAGKPGEKASGTGGATAASAKIRATSDVKTAGSAGATDETPAPDEEKRGGTSASAGDGEKDDGTSLLRSSARPAMDDSPTPTEGKSGSAGASAAADSAPVPAADDGPEQGGNENAGPSASAVAAASQDGHESDGTSASAAQGTAVADDETDGGASLGPVASKEKDGGTSDLGTTASTGKDGGTSDLGTAAGSGKDGGASGLGSAVGGTGAQGSGAASVGGDDDTDPGLVAVTDQDGRIGALPAADGDESDGTVAIGSAPGGERGDGGGAAGEDRTAALIPARDEKPPAPKKGAAKGPGGGGRTPAARKPAPLSIDEELEGWFRKDPPKRTPVAREPAQPTQVGMPVSFDAGRLPPAGPPAERPGQFSMGQVKKALPLLVLAVVIVALVAWWLGIRSAGGGGTGVAEVTSRPTPAVTASHTKSDDKDSERDKEDKTEPSTSAGPSQPAESAPAKSEEAAPPPQTTAPEESKPPKEEDEALPEGWFTHKDGRGFSIALPKGWSVFKQQDRSVWFHGPGAAKGSYLLVEEASDPRSDPLEDWYQQEKAVKGNFNDYKRVKIEKVDYMKAAADWEFTWRMSSGKAHVRNRGFVTDGGRGYALYWHTLADAWDKDLHYFDTFAKTFKPAK
ncbi:protein kinase [Spongiactinospora sp. TRM90649]|uniref:protein kinase domain-containing protein n=1 Tax=Spongiactinospora sp. TRM90649 TaxID=3031114 RepID=UPI0023F826DA|nr:protein kinase [Spongiactinospora sp. TRM90649]